jgi:Zn-dependent peptidase ImmA (M78 family)
MTIRALLLLALLSVPAAAQLPALPDSVPSLLGYIPVQLVPNLQCNNREVFGCYSSTQRVILIRADMSPVTAWQTLYHELGHATLHDAGVRLDPETEERVADAFATARLNFLLEIMRLQRQKP